MNLPKRARLDWGLLVFIVPVGIFLIIIVGQFAVRLMPFWSVNAGMRSNLQPDPASARPFTLLEPIMPQILTPAVWVEIYLTPGAQISFPPFLTFEPSASPSVTPASPSPTSTTPSPIATTPSPLPTTPVATTPPPPATCQDSAATNYGYSLPCTYPPPATCQDSAATNYGYSLPCTYPPPATCQDSAATNYGYSLPCTYSITSTPPPAYGTPAVADTKINVGSGPDTQPSDGDTKIGLILDGTYIIVQLSVVVSASADPNYDLAYYEYNNSGRVYMDRLIIGISKFADAHTYYEVFNWGNATPDANSNLGDVTPTAETDDQQVPLAQYHDPDGAGSAPQTGILIDVESAPSTPPPGTYDYVILISPLGGGGGGSAQIDAIQLVDVSPTP